MDFINAIIDVLICASLGTALVVAYLKVNKLWSRRHDVAVADSISVAAAVMGMTIALPYFIKYALLEPDVELAVREVIRIGVAGLFFMIGIGWWARRHERRGLTGLIRSAFRQEAREATDLARSFLHPIGARQILNILQQVAVVDGGYDDAEHRFISAFARTWRVKYADDPVKLNARLQSLTQDQLYIDLRKAVVRYLAMAPPKEQVAQLTDVIRRLVRVDRSATKPERFVLVEIDGLMNAYLDRRGSSHVYTVLLVPQNAEQETAIRVILPEATLSDQAGGKAFVVDTYYSRPFADLVCGQYRALNFFTTVETVDRPNAAT